MQADLSLEPLAFLRSDDLLPREARRDGHASDGRFLKCFRRLFRVRVIRAIRG